jgi:uncharacterized membrane protein
VHVAGRLQQLAEAEAEAADAPPAAHIILRLFCALCMFFAGAFLSLAMMAIPRPTYSRFFLAGAKSLKPKIVFFKSRIF